MTNQTMPARGNPTNQESVLRIGTETKTSGDPRDYLVTVFKALKSGDLYALILRVTVAQSIEWVRAHVDDIVAAGSQHDGVARNSLLPIVALNVASA